MTTYDKSFKEEALKLSDEIGVTKAAAQLGIPYYTLSNWRYKQRAYGDLAHVGSGHKREPGNEKDQRIRELERENAELQRANEILQEALGFFAKNRKKQKLIGGMNLPTGTGKDGRSRSSARFLGVSESGYYRYRKNAGKPDRDEVLSAAMQQILDEHPCNDNYGAPRMQLALRQRGIEVGIRRITRIMRKHGWLHTCRRPKGLTKADPEAMMSENLLKQDFSADEPYKKLLTDITQVQCKDGKLYISPILDCYNGEILSLIMRTNMKKELCMDTVKALSRYPVKGAILHSDRGSQYTSGGFRETLEKMGIQQSLSGVAHCYDNARMESFFVTLKKELLYRIPTYRMTVEQVKTRIFRYVFTYYNQMRVYTSNPDGLSPAVYRRMQMEKAAA